MHAACCAGALGISCALGIYALTAQLAVFGSIILVAPIFTAFIITAAFRRKLGGVTGDILGAVCELNQTSFLLIAIVAIEALGVYGV